MGIYLLIINVAALALMLADKVFAKKHARRIPESTLLLAAVLGGSPGALIGMYAARHKTRHARFFIGLPLILALQLAAATVILKAR